MTKLEAIMMAADMAGTGTVLNGLPVVIPLEATLPKLGPMQASKHTG